MRKESPDGSVIVYADADLSDLIKRLEAVLYAADSECYETLVFCLETQRGQIEKHIRSRFGPLSIIPVPDEDPARQVACLLNEVRSQRVAFLPFGACFNHPLWRLIPVDRPSIMPWVEYRPLPNRHSQAHPSPTRGWLASVSFLRQLKSTTPPRGWGLLNISAHSRQFDQTLVWASPYVTSPDHALPAGNGSGKLNKDSRILALVPHYRCEKWLEECVQSLVMQTRPLEGIAVIDDGSQRPPLEILLRFPQVTLLASAENVGPYRLVQQVISSTDYDGYLFQDADDWSTYDRLEILLTEAERAGAELIGSQELRILYDETDPLPVCYPLDVNAAFRQHPGFPLLHPTSLVSRDLVQRLGGFATGLRFGGDTEFLHRAAHVARIVNVPRYCYFRRVREGALTTASDTAIGSPARDELGNQLEEWILENNPYSARREADTLKPFAVAQAIHLTHMSGPRLTNDASD